MVELGEEPVLGHILKKLSQSGIRRAAVTLMYLPRVVEQGIGDGSEYGVEVIYRVEDEPLGTAGAARSCEELLEDGEELLVLSGDGISAADLSEVLHFHREKGAAATMVLARVPEPTEYGLVRLDGEGRVLGFAEKPDWDGVFTDLVNTGIYVLDREVLRSIPKDRKYDFSSEVFPGMIPGGRLFGYVSGDYWCDIGSPEAYLKCHMDYLEGRTGLRPDAPERESGVWVSERAEVSETARLVSPVLICEGAKVGPGAVLGPGTVLGPGAVAERDVSAVGCAVYGRLSAGAEAEDAIVCRGANVGVCTVLRRGSIVGPGADTGDHSFLASGAVLEENGRLERGSVRRAGKRREPERLCFERGTLPADAELCFSVGAALGSMGKKRVTVGESGSFGATRALVAGLMFGGAEVICHDGGYCGASAELGAMLLADAGAFVSGERLLLFGEHGAELTGGEEKKLLAAVSRGRGGGKNGEVKSLRGVPELLAAASAIPGKRLTEVWVSGEGPAREVMKKTLELSGFGIRNSPSALVLGPTSDGLGFRLSSRGEFSTEHTRGMALLLLALENPGARIAIGKDDPAAFGLALNRRGSSVVRVGLDPEGADLAARQRVGFFGAATAAALLDGLERRGLTPEELFGMLPAYATQSARILCETPGARLMEKLVGCFSRDMTERGTVISTPRGSARLSLSPMARSIRITCEAASSETAGELVREIAELAKSLDKKS